MASFSALLAEVRRCTICAEHLPHSPRPVLQLHEQARILVAAQAPGRKAHASGTPFTDVSGDRLREWMGISADTFYDSSRVAILPMAFCYPGSAKGGDLPPRPECAEAWQKKLLSPLRNLQLTLVIGRYAQAYHLQRSASVTSVVQAWRDHWPATVPLPHPSPRNKIWLHRNPWFERDLLPALRSRIADVLSHKS
jgi:uracil-DNA glycosylase